MSDKSVHDLLDQTTSRRRFLRTTAFTAVAAGVASACKDSSAHPVKTQAPAAPAHQMNAQDSLAAATASADAMDAMHEKGMKAFPAKTTGAGNQLMKPRIDDGVKVFELTATKMKWETEPGKFVEAWAYNEQVPGP